MSPLALFGAILPLYLCALAGFAAGRRLRVESGPVANLLFYVVIPVVLFRGALLTPLSAGALALPVAAYVLCLGLCLLFYQLSGLLWQDSRRDIIAAAAGLGNFGYFGLPVALAVMGPEVEGRYVVALLGPMLYNFTAGYFFTAKGRHGGRDALLRTLRLPALYAFLLGLSINLLGLKAPQPLLQLTEHFRGAYIVLGMLMVGLSLAPLRSLRLDWSFIGMTFLARFLAWPLAVLLLLSADRLWLGLFDASARGILALFSVVPLAASTAVLASLFRLHEEQVASAVLLSTLFAAAYVPLALSLLGRL
ncbi:MAG: AEC family transporter [Elusimicrobiota bacterium]